MYRAFVLYGKSGASHVPTTRGLGDLPIPGQMSTPNQERRPRRVPSYLIIEATLPLLRSSAPPLFLSLPSLRFLQLPTPSAAVSSSRGERRKLGSQNYYY